MFLPYRGEHESPSRWLAGEKEKKELDYTVFAVAVYTLALILAVELLRHKLDIKAMGRPFFKSIMGGVYRECKLLLILMLMLMLMLCKPFALSRMDT
jgi:hypothetical protein